MTVDLENATIDELRKTCREQMVTLSCYQDQLNQIRTAMGLEYGDSITDCLANLVGKAGAIGVEMTQVRGILGARLGQSTSERAVRVMDKLRELESDQRDRIGMLASPGRR